MVVRGVQAGFQAPQRQDRRCERWFFVIVVKSSQHYRAYPGIVVMHSVSGPARPLQPL